MVNPPERDILVIGKTSFAESFPGFLYPTEIPDARSSYHSCSLYFCPTWSFFNALSFCVICNKKILTECGDFAAYTLLHIKCSLLLILSPGIYIPQSTFPSAEAGGLEALRASINHKICWNPEKYIFRKPNVACAISEPCNF